MIIKDLSILIALATFLIEPKPIGHWFPSLPYDSICQRHLHLSGGSLVTSFCGSVHLANIVAPSFIFTLYNKTSTPFKLRPYASPRKVSILVSGGDFREFSPKTISNHLLFSALRQIPYLYADVSTFRKHNDFLKAEWLKVQLLRDMLIDPLIPEHSWIVWVDDDLVLNHHTETMIDSYIIRYEAEASVIITKDNWPWDDKTYDAGFNTGVVMVKKSDISRKFFSDWWHKRPSSKEMQKHYIPPNQYALRKVLDNNDYEARGHLAIAPQRSQWGNMNTFHTSDQWQLSPTNGLATKATQPFSTPGLATR